MLSRVEHEKSFIISGPGLKSQGGYSHDKAPFVRCSFASGSSPTFGALAHSSDSLSFGGLNPQAGGDEGNVFGGGGGGGGFGSPSFGGQQQQQQQNTGNNVNKF